MHRARDRRARPEVESKRVDHARTDLDRRSVRLHVAPNAGDRGARRRRRRRPITNVSIRTPGPEARPMSHSGRSAIRGTRVTEAVRASDLAGNLAADPHRGDRRQHRSRSSPSDPAATRPSRVEPGCSSFSPQGRASRWPRWLRPPGVGADACASPGRKVGDTVFAEIVRDYRTCWPETPRTPLITQRRHQADLRRREAVRPARRGRDPASTDSRHELQSDVMRRGLLAIDLLLSLQSRGGLTTDGDAGLARATCSTSPLAGRVGVGEESIARCR